MTCAFTKPTVVPTASAWIGTSFWRTVVTRTSGGGGAGGSALLQALPKVIASMASVATNPRDALEQCMTNSIPDLSEAPHVEGRHPGGERRPHRELLHRLRRTEHGRVPADPLPEARRAAHDVRELAR